MSFQGVTFSGVDESVHPAQLLEIRSHYFPVEWGIWLAEDQEKQPRFPGIGWIKGLPPASNLSAHLYGSLAQDFLAGNDTVLIARYGEILPLFRRIQISSEAEKINSKGWKAIAERYKDKKLTVEVSAENPNTAVLEMKPAGPFSLLFNRRKSGAQWPKAPKGAHGCGYAGGLSPENLSKQLSLLMSAARQAEYWWIELSTSLRTTENGQDLFSCGICKKVLREIEGYFLDYVI
jgi:hypothetical protein